MQLEHTTNQNGPTLSVFNMRHVLEDKNYLSGSHITPLLACGRFILCDRPTGSLVQE